MLALQKFYISRSEETLAECYEALNAMDMSGLVQYPGMTFVISCSKTNGQ